MNKFIFKDSLAITIIEIKKNLFGKEYITCAEFNKEGTEIIITSNFCDLDAVKVDSGIITLSSNPLTIISISHLSEYVYIIAELIMEFAEYDLQKQKEEFEKFRSDNRTFDEKQKSLLKRLLN